jgi:hypothetical protein
MRKRKIFRARLKAAAMDSVLASLVIVSFNDVSVLELKFANTIRWDYRRHSANEASRSNGFSWIPARAGLYAPITC